MPRRIVLVLAIFAFALGSGPAGAQDRGPTRPFAYAVVVGSNPGGPGQHPLAYAERDAQRMARILTELGGYDSRNVRVLLRSDARTVLSTLDALKRQLQAHRSRGEDAQLVFYYSGHARANALNLGPHVLSLATLREQLMALPTTLTVVILDACQNGAFSRAKGVKRAAAQSNQQMMSEVRRLEIVRLLAELLFRYLWMKSIAMPTRTLWLRPREPQWEVNMLHWRPKPAP